MAPLSPASCRPAPIAALAALTLLAGACGERQFGMGIGRPPIREVVRTEPLDLVISEAYVAAADPADRFVEIVATGGDTIPLADLHLCNGRDACIALTGDATPGTRVLLLNDTGSLDPLDLRADIGELAIVDADSFVHAYLAWGADPSTLGSTLYAEAVADGAVALGGFVSLPYPMTAGVAIAAGGSQTGCAAPTPDAPTSFVDIDPSHCPEVAPTLHLTEVFVAAAAGDDSWVEIQNLGSTTLQLYGVRLCQPPSCVVLADTDSLAPGEFLELHLGVDTPASATAIERYFPAASPLAAAGEVALYAPGPAALDDPASMLSYVRYGVTTASLAMTAFNAGVWATASDSAPEPIPGTESIGAVGARGASGTGWSVGRPTPGFDARCGAPVSPAVPLSDLVVRSIERTTPARITLRNDGPSPLDATRWRVELGALSLPLGGPIDLAVAAEIIVELDPEADGCAAGNKCWVDPGAVINADGDASLRRDTNLSLFVRWGDGPTLRASDAVTAGVWPHELCATRSLGDGDALHRIDGTTGHSPLDYE